MFGRRRAFYWMAVPAVLLFVFFHTVPALQGVFYSFTDSRGYGDWTFVGFDNYVRLFSDPQIRSSYAFTFKFAILATVLANAVSLMIAVGLSANIRFRGFLRGVFFLPAVLAVIVVGFIFNYLLANVVPGIGQDLGIEALSTNVLGNPDLAWLGIVFVAVWQGCAVTTVIYMAGLQTIPEEITEAAVLDGASAWQRFWRVTFPMMAPFFTINMVLSLKNFLMVFDQIVALTAGGPGTATQSISYLIYRNGFTGGQFAYQSANAVIYFIVLAVISVFQLGLLRRREVSA
ncbi:MAG TPA: sugar ABC transporter permease [Friedmanniella sp.]